MRTNLEESLRHVLVHEGGYVNNKKDPGGPTNRGVTQAVYDGYRTRKGLPSKSVRSITLEEVSEIYSGQYWNPIRGDDLPVGLDYAVFDFAVNSGASRAIKTLQSVLGVRMDGVIGEKTLSAAMDREVVSLIEEYVEARMKFLRGLKPRNGKGGWQVFGRGWTRRVMGEIDGFQGDDVGVIDRAICMVNGESAPLPTASVEGKATEPERAGVSESSVVQSTVADIALKVGAGASILPSLDFRAQILVGVGLIVMLGLSIVIFRGRLRAWADGWR